MMTELAHLATPELRFLAACSYIPRSEQGLAKQKHQLTDASLAGHQPSVLWEGIQRHRIFVLAEHILLAHHMQQALGDFFPMLQSRARQTRRQNIGLLFASVQLSTSLSEAGIGHRFLKGPLLSQKIYGDPGFRHSKDLDLIVVPLQMNSAIRVLQANGWEFTDDVSWPKSGSTGVAALCRHHFELHHPRQEIGLELHWRIEMAPISAVEEKWWSLWQGPPSELPPAESLFLCLHGAVHAWTRLKWLGDLAAIIERQPNLWRDSQEISAALRLDLVVAQTILLLQVLFGIEPDAAACGILNRQPRAYALAKLSLTEMKEAQVCRRESARRSWAFRRYSAKIEARYSLRERFLYRLIFWLSRGGSVLFHHPALLAAMPRAFATSFVQRRF